MPGIRKIAKEMTNKEDAHGHERAEIEPNHDEGGHCVYERILIHGELRSRQGVNIDKRTRKEQYQYDARDRKHSAELHNCQRRSRRHQRAGSQVKCAIIDGINREKVQHAVCSSERPGVNIAMSFLQCLA
jgi:hypothetical protein